MSGLRPQQNSVEARGSTIEPSVGDYITLMKPRVMSLVVFTALVGLVAAPGGIHPVLAIIALISITIGAGARVHSICGTTPISTPTWPARQPVPSRRGRVTAEKR